MSFVDFEPQPQQPPFDLWENPHPRGFIAMLKRSLNMIPDMVNGSIAATGAPPSTEEEAFLYNLARDRGIAGAFSAASTFGPAAPQFVRAARDAASRAIPQALERDAPRHLNGPGTGNMPGPAVLPSPDRFRTNPSGWPSPGSSVPSVLPPVAGSAPSGGLLARLRELDAMERQAAAGTGSSAPVRDPNFRQLSRFPVLPTLEQTGSIATDLLDIPDFLRRTPRAPTPDSIVTETDEPPNTSDGGGRKGTGRKGGGGGGGEGGGGRGKGRRPKYEELCEKRHTEERNRCYNYEDDPVHPHYFKACQDRATERWLSCDKHGGLDHPGPGEWRPGTDAWPGDEETWLNHRR